MRTKLSTLAMPMITAGALSTAVFGLFVGHRAEEVIRNFETSCEMLRLENAELRAEIARLTEAPITISVVQTEFAPKTLARKNRNWTAVKALDHDTWKGQIGTDRFGHAIFEAPEWSLRACALTLRSYETRHGVKTVKALVERYCEGNREEYVDFLCKALGVKAEQEFSFSARIPELVCAIARFESGEAIPEEHVALMALK